MKRNFLLLLLWLLPACLTLQEPVQEATDVGQLAELDAKIAAGDFGDINSMLIWHDGALVWEAYYRGTGPDSLYEVYSVTKSFTSAMIGKAMQEGYISALDAPMLVHFPQYETVENLDGRKEAITLEDLLTMRAGFAWDELSSTYGDANNDVTNLARSRDWTKYVLDLEMAAEPGTTFTYNSGVTMLLGGMLQQATGQTAADYTAVHLFQPLGITQWRWQETPTGSSNTGWGLSLRASDMLKFGRLYLQEGNWQGEKLLDAAWVAQSTRPLVQISDEFSYGYQWWRFGDQYPVVTGLAENDVYFAWGFGGNFIFVIPHLDLVVVSTAENFGDGDRFFAALSDYIFPAFD